MKLGPGFKHRNVKIVITGKMASSGQSVGSWKHSGQLLTSSQEAAYWVALLGGGSAVDSEGALGGLQN